jgi:hypothetical protein
LLLPVPPPAALLRPAVSLLRPMLPPAATLPGFTAKAGVLLLVVLQPALLLRAAVLALPGMLLHQRLAYCFSCRAHGDHAQLRQGMQQQQQQQAGLLLAACCSLRGLSWPCRQHACCPARCPMHRWQLQQRGAWTSWWKAF